MNETFEQTAQNLTAKQIVETMIDAVRNPAIKLDFDTFGQVRNGECVACAATNTVCKLSGKVFDENSIGSTSDRADFLNVDWRFLDDFELAIDDLRNGRIFSYNSYARKIGIAELKKPDFILPALTNENYLENLRYYEKLAEIQE